MNRKRNDERESDLPANLSQPALRALAGAGYSRLEQVTDVSEADLKRLHGMGPKAFEQLRRALSARGLSFADEKGGAIRSCELRTVSHEALHSDPAPLLCGARTEGETHQPLEKWWRSLF